MGQGITCHLKPMYLNNLAWELNVRHQNTINMDAKSVHNKDNSILKNFDKREKF